MVFHSSEAIPCTGKILGQQWSPRFLVLEDPQPVLEERAQEVEREAGGVDVGDEERFVVLLPCKDVL